MGVSVLSSFLPRAPTAFSIRLEEVTQSVHGAALFELGVCNVHNCLHTSSHTSLPNAPLTQCVHGAALFELGVCDVHNCLHTSSHTSLPNAPLTQSVHGAALFELGVCNVPNCLHTSSHTSLPNAPLSQCVHGAVSLELGVCDACNCLHTSTPPPHLPPLTQCVHGAVSLELGVCDVHNRLELWGGMAGLKRGRKSVRGNGGDAGEESRKKGDGGVCYSCLGHREGCMGWHLGNPTSRSSTALLPAGPTRNPVHFTQESLCSLKMPPRTVQHTGTIHVALIRHFPVPQ